MKCFATTNSVQITAHGKIQPCCKFKTPLGDVSQLDDYFTLPALLELHTAHNAGNWTKNCISCQRNEERGTQSRRKMYEIIGLEGDDFFLDVSMGNYCNLACRMCNSENSTSWFVEHDKLADRNLLLPRKNKAFTLTDDNIAAIINIVKAQTGKVIIEVKGGEPLLMPMAFKFFSALAECVNSVNMEIWMTSNLTRIPSWWLDLSGEFKSVQFNVSIDGLGVFYNYIRGANYDSTTILSQVETLRHFCNNHRLRFNIVVQNLNMNNLAELYDTCLRYVNGQEDITLIPLNDPAYYQPNVFPDDQKPAVLAMLAGSEIVNNRDYVGIVDYFMQPCPADTWQQFLKISKALDEMRGQDLCSVMKVT